LICAYMTPRHSNENVFIYSGNGVRAHPKVSQTWEVSLQLSSFQVALNVYLVGWRGWLEGMAVMPQAR